MNTIEPRINYTRNTDRGPSPAIWADCPVLEYLEDPGKGFYLYEDFRSLALLATPTITTEALYSNGWKAFGSAGGTLLPGFIEGGSGLIATETDDNQGINFGTIARPFQLDRGKGAFWWECRLKNSVVTDNENGFFAGLIDSYTGTAILPIAADGTLADENFVGFHRLEGDGDQLDVVYKADGVTQVSVQSDVLSTTNTVAGALAADTYIKLGMKYDPSTFYLSFFVNNLELATRKQIPAADGTDFPNDVQMGLVFAMLCASNNDSVLTVDYVRVAQDSRVQ